MEKLTLDHFKQVIAEKYGYKSWRDLKEFWSNNFKDFEDFCDDAAELYANYSREDQNKIAVEKALDWAANISERFNKLGWDTLTYDVILKGKTDKSLQYENTLLS